MEIKKILNLDCWTMCAEVLENPAHIEERANSTVYVQWYGVARRWQNGEVEYFHLLSGQSWRWDASGKLCHRDWLLPMKNLEFEQLKSDDERFSVYQEWEQSFHKWNESHTVFVPGREDDGFVLYVNVPNGYCIVAVRYNRNGDCSGSVEYGYEGAAFYGSFHKEVD